MCLAVPVRVIEVLSEQRARASIGGIVREIDVSLVEDLRAGEYVILHVGYALAKLDEDEARRTLAMMEEAGVLGELRHEVR